MDGNHVEKKRDDAELSSKLEGDRAYHDFLLTRSLFPRNGLDWTKRSSVIAGALDIPGQAMLDARFSSRTAGQTFPTAAEHGR